MESGAELEAPGALEGFGHQRNAEAERRPQPLGLDPGRWPYREGAVGDGQVHGSFPPGVAGITRSRIFSGSVSPLASCHLAAAVENPSDRLAGRDVARQHVPPADRVLRRPAEHSGGFRPLAEHLALGEPSGQRVLRGAPELVGGGDPQEGLEGGPGTRHLAGQSPVGGALRALPRIERRRQVAAGQGLDLVHQRARRPQPFEEAAGERRSGGIVGVGGDASAPLPGGGRLAEVVAEGGEQQGPAGIAIAGGQFRRAVHRQQGVFEDIALRMPLGILGNPAEGVHLRQEPQEPGGGEKTEASRRFPAVEQFLEFVQDPFRTQLGEVQLATQTVQFFVGGEPEAGSEGGPPAVPRSGSSGNFPGSVARITPRARSRAPP